MSDPRVPARPRLPKSYTDQQLAFLKRHLPEFERRTQGSVRGDAKKYALERAAEFISTFGIPEDYAGVEEAEPRFKEQIYNWFKNTVGRTRRKLEGKPRSMKKALEKKQQQAAAQETNSNISLLLGSPSAGDTSALSNAWPTNVATPTVMPYASADHSAGTSTSNQTLAPINYGGVQSSAVLAPIPSPSTHSTPHTSAHPTTHTSTHPNAHTSAHASAHTAAHNQPSPRPHHSSLGLANVPTTSSSIREAFMTGIDASSLASMIRSFVMSNPSQTPLTAVVEALFEATTTDLSYNQEPHVYLRRFLDASSYFPSNIIHAGVPGPLAGPRALQMQIRKYSIWIPSPSPLSASSTTLADEVQRIANDRQRKKDHIQWARIHAAALELGMLNIGSTDPDSNYSYVASRAFSEMMARDAVWEKDEVEWVAGVFVLRAVIRTAIGGDQRKRGEYDELLRNYEKRWKEMKDEARQALVGDVLLAAREDLMQMDRMLS